MRWIALQARLLEHGSVLFDEASTQHAVASLALSFTPRVALAGGAVLMDVTGSLRLFGGLMRLTTLLEQKITQFFASSQAVAQLNRTQGATSLIAYGRLVLQTEGPEIPKNQFKLPKRVADMPLHTLAAAGAHVVVLERIGCRTWGDLLNLPRDGMARRFGADLLEALDRARGAVPDTYNWLVLPEQFDEKLELDALMTHAPLLMAGVERLLIHLQAWLLGRQSGLSALKLTWHLDKRRDVAPTGELEIRTAQPAQNLAHVARLIAEHLAQQKLPAPVHAISLQSLTTERLVDAALATTSLLMEAGDKADKGDSAAQLVERLSARLGKAQIQAWQPQADHRPEAMQRWVDAMGATHWQLNRKSFATKSIAARARKIRAAVQKGGQKEPQNAFLKVFSGIFSESLYPTWLLPEPLRLQTAGNSPLYQGKLVRLAGPQRLEASGWLASNVKNAGQQNCADHSPAQKPAIRDYFIYRSQQASLLWVYSERLAVDTLEAPQQNVRAVAFQRRAWYLHGFFA
jgi:protein ImuB